ncbi:hypothetical protein B0T26DRAFT_695240 [Lasiosphaeria miniovina]|uniref:Uncharacterized protein n=1 Tax=Lasiosphaeria miniovina TaxID=1954250 RepID=A0AA40E595_9PEZI|nr:uncharacterized protein B0T26DRAFT_695240 [Lasiosphaeria miniovina]KAK0727640.1 hypothetical protein B0T26DRAFT_695240 [Lasiosphaeria miniovina]
MRGLLIPRRPTPPATSAYKISHLLPSCLQNLPSYNLPHFHSHASPAPTLQSSLSSNHQSRLTHSPQAHTQSLGSHTVLRLTHSPQSLSYKSTL